VAYILTALTAYLLGSIPTGFLVGRARGIDIRVVGSGNIGATNVFRILGKPAGVIVMLVDVLKGWLAVFIVAKLLGQWFYPDAGPKATDWLRIVASLMAVLGHNYTCWLGFKGGKGIATSAGVLAALVPWSFLIILIVFVVLLVTSRYVSVASISAASTLPFAAWFTGESATIVAVTAAMAALAIYKHRPNIQRLLKGTENRIGAKKPPVADAGKPAN